MVLLAAWCGLRFGELAALQRGGLNLTAGTVTVDETLTELLGGKVPMFTGAPKTKAGRRTVAIPSNIRPAIKARLETVGTEPTALVFPAPQGGYLSRVHFRQRVWLPALEATGLSFRFHDLRHCALTVAAEAGATIAELMARGGHSSPATAMRYQHASAQRDQALAERMAALG
jgi:integrase